MPENYDVHWRGIDWRNKAVLDIGADWGSTAFYFLKNGASMVYAVEGNPVLFKRLEINAKTRNIVPIFVLINSPNHFTRLISECLPDVAKIDCEGCERHLMHVPDNIFSSVREYIIEAHSANLFEKIKEKLLKNHYCFETFNYAHLKVLLGRN